MLQSSHLDAQPFCVMQNIFNFFATNMRFYDFAAKKNPKARLAKKICQHYHIDYIKFAMFNFTITNYNARQEEQRAVRDGRTQSPVGETVQDRSRYDNATNQKKTAETEGTGIGEATGGLTEDQISNLLQRLDINGNG